MREKIKDVQRFWVDGNNNKWDKELYEKREAEFYSITLKNCYNCINCCDSEDCTSCVGCIDCVHCNRCDSCSKCERCEQCNNCFECNGNFKCKVCFNYNNSCYRSYCKN